MKTGFFWEGYALSIKGYAPLSKGHWPFCLLGGGIKGFRECLKQFYFFLTNYNIKLIYK